MKHKHNDILNSQERRLLHKILLVKHNKPTVLLGNTMILLFHSTIATSSPCISKTVSSRAIMIKMTDTDSYSYTHILTDLGCCLLKAIWVQRWHDMDTCAVDQVDNSIISFLVFITQVLSQEDE